MDLLNKYNEFLHNENKTFFLVEAPTGSGKTYSAKRFITQNYKTNRIIFIANQHTLLPKFNDFLSFLEDKEDFKNNFLYLKSTLETFKERFDIDLLNDEFCQNNKIIIRELDKIVKALKDKSNGLSEYLENDFYETEIKFRNSIKEFCRKYKGNQNLKEYIKSQDWIINLYPQVLFDSKKVIVMTSKKFFLPIDPLYETSFNLMDGLEKNAILIIDEIDTLKKELQNIIIENIDKSVFVDPFRLVKKIIPTILKLEIDEYDNVSILTNNLYNDLRKTCKAFQKKHTYITKKFKCKLENLKSVFLFNDKKIQLISDSNQSNIYYNEEKYFNNVSFEKSEKVLNILLKEVMDIFDDFVKFIFYLSNNYKDHYNNIIVKNSNKNLERLEFIEAVSTIIDSFNLGEENYKYLINKVKKYASNKQLSTFIIEDKSKIKHYNFYRDGFSYIKLENSYMHETETKFRLYEYNTSPEAYLLACAEKYKIIGISATANNESTLVNFDMKFIELYLNKKFLKLTGNEIIQFKQKYRENEILKYKDVDIDFKDFEIKFKNNKKFIEEKLVKLVGDVNLFKEHVAFEDYKIELLFELYSVFSEYIKTNDCQSFVYFMNLNIENSDLKKCCIKTLDEILRVNNESCIIEFVTSKKYRDQENDIKKKLELGERIFIITSYQSLGAGVNLDYKITEENTKKFYPNLISKIGENKDFDGVYLSKPTNIFPSTLNKDFSTKNLANSLYSIEYMNIYGDLKEYEFKDSLRKCINSFTNLSESTFIQSKYINKNSIAYGMLRFLEQSLGRLTRTSNKSNTYIWVNSSCLNIIAKCINYLNSKWNNLLMEELINYFEINENYYVDYKIQNFEKEAKVFKQIKDILIKSKSEWIEENIKFWVELRNYVLKHPTINRNDDDISKNYFQFDQDESSYSYSELRTFNFERLHKVSNKEIYPKMMSEEHSKLNRMMNIPGCKDFFIENGYATCFEKNKFLMPPTLYSAIYLGALGECVGCYILSKFNIILSDLQNEKEKFEKFDYRLSKNVYIDFKNWHYYEKDKKKALSNIVKKAQLINAKKIYICNILFENFNISNIYNINGITIVTIPWLFNDFTNKFNDEMISKMKEDYYG